MVRFCLKVPTISVKMELELPEGYSNSSLFAETPTCKASSVGYSYCRDVSRTLHLWALGMFLTEMKLTSLPVHH